MRAVEWGIGYEGVFADFRVFESYAWAHRLAAHRELGAVRFFDTVIPNAFDPGDLMRSHEPGDYLLYLGRMTAMKGLAIVGDIAARVDYPVITAGQGPERVPGAEHVGVVTGMDKARLLADARAVLVPTMYLEPFGGVAVEAMLCGTPAVTTDWGAFTETVSPGVSGFRCSTLAEFVDAVHRAGDMDRVAVADYAACRYTTDVVGPMYDRYLARLATLGDAGWYTMPPAG
jgi:glycosyltransferase involved in cell wall biosynthesis